MVGIYSLQFPELVDVLSSMYNMMESRTALYSRLIKLQGKLNLVLSQVSLLTTQTLFDT